MWYSLFSFEGDLSQRPESNKLTDAECFCSIGPVSQFHQNSKYYSAIPAAPNKLVDSNLPHVTIEMPVYKESLKETMYAARFFYDQAPDR